MGLWGPTGSKFIFVFSTDKFVGKRVIVVLDDPKIIVESILEMDSVRYVQI